MKIWKWLAEKMSRIYWSRNCRCCGYYDKETNMCFVHGKCKKNCVIS